MWKSTYISRIQTNEVGNEENEGGTLGLCPKPRQEAVPPAPPLLNAPYGAFKGIMRETAK